MDNRYRAFFSVFSSFSLYPWYARDKLPAEMSVYRKRLRPGDGWMRVSGRQNGTPVFGRWVWTWAMKWTVSYTKTFWILFEKVIFLQQVLGLTNFEEIFGKNEWKKNRWFVKNVFWKWKTIFFVYSTIRRNFKLWPEMKCRCLWNK